MNLENGLEIHIVNICHLVANDGCCQKLKKSPINLKEEDDNIVWHHNIAIENGVAENYQRVVNLLYFNISWTDAFFKENRTLPFTCPVCDKKYKLLKADYLRLRRESSIPKIL